MQLHPIQTLVVDNDSSIEELLIMIRDNCPEVEVVSACHTIETAFKSIRRFSPSLVILAIDLTEGNGFGLLKMCRNFTFKTIIISSSRECAVEAFRFSAADCLLKPVKSCELKQAIGKVSLQMEMEKFYEDKTNGKDLTNNHLIIANTKGFIVVRFEDVILCEASSYCTVFNLTGNRKLSSSQNLKHYAELLPGNRFMRVHNSFIINLEHVKGYTFQGEIQLSENLKCSLSAANKKAFQATFGKMK